MPSMWAEPLFDFRSNLNYVYIFYVYICDHSFFLFFLFSSYFCLQVNCTNQEGRYIEYFIESYGTTFHSNSQTNNTLHSLRRGAWMDLLPIITLAYGPWSFTYCLFAWTAQCVANFCGQHVSAHGLSMWHLWPTMWLGLVWYEFLLDTQSILSHVGMWKTEVNMVV